MTTPWEALVALDTIALVALISLVIGLLRRVDVVVSASVAPRESDPMGIEVGRIVDLGRLAADEPDCAPLVPTTAGLSVLFMDAACGPCRSLARALEASGERYAGLVVVFDDVPESYEITVGQLQTVYDPEGRVRAAFMNRATPQLYDLDARGVVRSRRIVQGVDDLAGRAVGKVVAVPKARVEASIQERG